MYIMGVIMTTLILTFLEAIKDLEARVHCKSHVTCTPALLGQKTKYIFSLLSLLLKSSSLN